MPQLSFAARVVTKMQHLKRLGYLISIVSVFLLAATSWAKAKGDPTLMLCLTGGVLTSIVGMSMRWLSYELEQREKRQSAARSDTVQRAHATAAA